MCTHAVAQGKNCPKAPEHGPAAFAGQEQAQEPEQGQECACVVVIQLEWVVSPIERRPARGLVFLYGKSHERTAFQFPGLVVVFIDVHPDEPGQEHLGQFLLMQGPAYGMAQVGVVPFATDGLGGGVHVGRYHLKAADGKPEGESRCR